MKLGLNIIRKGKFTTLLNYTFILNSRINNKGGGVGLYKVYSKSIRLFFLQQRSTKSLALNMGANTSIHA